MDQAAPRHRRRLAGLSLLALITIAAITFGAIQVFVPSGGSGVSAQTLAAQKRSRALAAAWVSSQVSPGTIIACDPVMCAGLRAAGVPESALDTLEPASNYPVDSGVVVMTAAVRSQFGSSLAAAYAPAVLARFGSGLATVEVRVISRKGANAYKTALQADITERKQDADALLGVGQRISFAVQARSALMAGRVDGRLIIALANLGAQNPITIKAFGDSGPGASAGMPLRSVDFAPTDGAKLSKHSAYVNSVIKMLSGQNSPYRVASVALIPRVNPKIVRIQFGSPSPLGLLEN